jgi:hypothetical protein
MRRGSVPTIIPNLPDTDDDEDGDLPVPDEIIIPDTIPLTETINLSDPFTGELIDIKDEK